MVALKRSFAINSVTGLCITKLDVLDGMPTLKICTAYEMDGQTLDTLPVGADAVARCTPRYLELPGWSESTVGTDSLASLPPNARAYLKTIEDLCGLPIDLLSTGPDRAETLVLRNPFEGEPQ